MTKIIFHIDPDGFLGNDPSAIESIDIDASLNNYCHEVTKRFGADESEYIFAPTMHSLAIVEGREDEKDLVSDIEDQVYSDGKFWVLRNQVDVSKYDKFGTVEFEGKTYFLTEQASLTNRLFNGSWSTVENGEEYTAEWESSAINKYGDKFKVVWQFDQVKGQEPEDDGDLPFVDENILKILEQ